MCIIFFQLNSVITCYVCVQLIRFIYIYIFICICFVSNNVLLKVTLCMSTVQMLKKIRKNLKKIRRKIRVYNTKQIDKREKTHAF